MRACDVREEASRLARLAVQLIGEEDGRISAPLCRLCRRRTEPLHAARDVRLDIRQGCRQRLVEQCLCRIREANVIFLHDPVRILCRRCVGVRGA